MTGNHSTDSAQARNDRLENALKGLLAHAETKHQAAQRRADEAATHDSEARTPGEAYLWARRREAHTYDCTRTGQEVDQAQRALKRHQARVKEEIYSGIS